MHSWSEIKAQVVNACGDMLTPHGYRFVKSRSSFEKTTATDRLSVQLLLASSDVGNYFTRIGCGLRNGVIEKLVNGPPADMTVRWGFDTLWLLNTSDEQASTISGLQTYIRDVALPFLEKHYSFQQLSELLNITDAAGVPAYRTGMGTRFWQRGLAAARLAGDARCADLKIHYTNHVRSLSGGIYYPEFEKAVCRIEAFSAPGCRNPELPTSSAD